MDSAAKRKWERENVLTVTIKVNRNQDPLLYDALLFADSRAGLIRRICERVYIETFVRMLDSEAYIDHLRDAIYRAATEEHEWYTGILLRNGVITHGAYLYGRDLERLCKENGVIFFNELNWYWHVGHHFRVMSPFLDRWYKKYVLHCSLPLPYDCIYSGEDLVTMARECGVSLNELMELVITID